MAIQTLNTIKNWFKTGLKPSQAQFWDTWDSFRHKFEKVPVKDIEGIDELLLTKADKTVLDNHLADKNAHAPQVNTDWNSESGFSQLLNKPEFKTINGEPLTGGGDIVIEAGGAQNLQTTLDNGNETTNSIMFNDDYYNWLKTSIDSRSVRLTDSNSDMLVAIDSAGVVTRDDSQHVSINPQGIFFNRDTAESYLRINTSSTSVSTINLPVTEGTEITLAAKEDFKTINGETIVGEGNLDIEPQGLKSVLDADPTASYGESKATVMGDYGTSKYNELIVSDDTEKTGIYQLKNQLSFDHTALDSNDIGNITLSEGNIKLTRDKSNNQTVVDISDPVANTQLRFPAKSEEGKTYTIATTEDFKTINGESIVGEGDITIGGGNGDIPTLQQVLDSGNETENSKVILRAGVTSVGTNIIDGYAVEMRLDNRILVANTSQVALTEGNKGSQLVPEGLKSFDDQGIQNNFNYPYKPFGTYTLATLDDIPSGGSQTLDQTLGFGNVSDKTIELTEGNKTNELSSSLLKISQKNTQTDWEETEISLNEGIKFTVAGFGMSRSINLKPQLQNTDDVKSTVFIPNKTGTIALLDDVYGVTLNSMFDYGGGTKMTGGKYISITNGNLYAELGSNELTMRNGDVYAEYGSSGISWSTEGWLRETTLTGWNGGGANFDLPNKPAATTQVLTVRSDFKTINGQTILGAGNVNFTSPTPTLADVLNEGSVASKAISLLTNSKAITYNGESITGDINQVGTNKLLLNNRTESGLSTYSFNPQKVAGNYTLATTSDFKTINGQSIVGTGDISVYDDNVLHKTGNESKEGDLNITGNLGITGNIEITDMDTFPRPPETNIILNKNGDLTATNFIGRSITSFTGQFHSNVTIGTAGYNGSKLEVNGTISTNGINVAAALTESSDVIFNSTPVGSQRTIAGNTIQIAGATGDYFLETFRYNASDYGMQRITFTSTASAGRFFIRTLTAGVWSAWIEKQ